MFGWFKQKHTQKETLRKLQEIKELFLRVNIPDKASYEQITNFCAHVEQWNVLLTDSLESFNVALSIWSNEDKICLFNHINKQLDLYSKNMVEFNDFLVNFLGAENISMEAKSKIATFGKSNLEHIEKNINILKNMAKHIASKIK